MFKILLTIFVLINSVYSEIDPCLCTNENICIGENEYIIDGCHKKNDISFCYVVGYENCKYAIKSKSCLDFNGNNLYYLVWHADDCSRNNFIDEYYLEDYTITDL